MFRDQLMEDRIRFINRMHWEMRIHFPEYKDALGKVDGAFSLELLKQAPFPEDILALGESGIRQIWHEAKLRGRGYSRAGEILWYAQASVDIRDGVCAGRMAVKWFVEMILEIFGIGVRIISGIIAERGDISRFDDVRELQKPSGLGLVACNSSKYKGETRISHRGRKRVRYWLFQAARSVVAHVEKIKEIHTYYTMRPENTLKKMQARKTASCSG